MAPFGQSRMLPREAYVDQAVFEWEQHAHLLRLEVRRPCLRPGRGRAPRRRSVPAPNAVLLVRGDDDVLRAFANTCRHRGHELLACGATAKRRSIVCPYHSWSYRLDGTLRNAPGFKRRRGLRRPTSSGSPSCGWWIGTAGCSSTPAAQDAEFADHVAGLEDVVAPYRPEDLTIVARHSYELATNWKVIAENYQECYHCSTIHPELSRISPPTSGENLELDGLVDGRLDVDRSTRPRPCRSVGNSGGVAIQGLSEHELRTVMYLVGYPNLLVSLHPDYVMTHLMTPLAVDRTHVECAWAFPKEVAAKPDFDPSYAVDFWDLTNRQDWAACESVQRGLSSPARAPGTAGARRGRRLPVRHPGGPGLPGQLTVTDGCGPSSRLRSQDSCADGAHDEAWRSAGAV